MSPNQVAGNTNFVGLTGPEIDALTWQEVGGLARSIAQARVIIFPVVCLLTFGFVLLQPDPWRVWLFAGTSALVAIILVRDFIWLRHRELKPAQVMYVLTVVLVFQTVVIAITGGAESPILVIYVVMGIVPAVVLGRPRPFFGYAVIPLSLIWFFTLTSVTALLPRLTPDYWGPGIAFGNNGVYAITRATIFSVSMLLGGTVGLGLRQALSRAVHRAIHARQELVTTMRERNRELLSLSGELAHELKNPLASIQGLSALIARKLPEGSKEAEQMSVLIDEVKRMGANLDEFLTFSRPITSLAVREVHPAELLADVALMHEGLAHQQRIRLEIDPGDAMPIHCDPRKVKQVLINLLQNAMEATPAGGRVDIGTAHGPGGAAKFIIDDSGPGLAPEIRGGLFSPGATTKDDGTGLGLTIARAIAEQHGGTLTLEEREQGCRAVLTLPRRPQETSDPDEDLPPNGDAS
ncbi:MAG: HAMP domain-containing sensor histidine kinase [bacterium]